MFAAAWLQKDASRKDANFEQLVSILNQCDQHDVIATGDLYLNRLLPGYVRQRFLAPFWLDPMSDKEIGTLDDLAGQLLGDPQTTTSLNESRRPDDQLSPRLTRLDGQPVDSNAIIMVINRHQPTPNRPARIILVNDDFEVGFAGQGSVTGAAGSAVSTCLRQMTSLPLL